MKTRDITLTAILTTLIFIATLLIRFTFPFAQGGLVHIGGAVFFLTCMIFGKNIGAISGSLGMALFDILTGYIIWAPATFIIRFISGYFIGAFTKDKKNTLNRLIILIIASIFIIFGYYIYEALIISENFTTPIASILGNSIEVLFATIVSLILISKINMEYFVKK